MIPLTTLSSQLFAPSYLITKGILTSRQVSVTSYTTVGNDNVKLYGGIQVLRSGTAGTAAAANNNQILLTGGAKTASVKLQGAATFRHKSSGPGVISSYLPVSTNLFAGGSIVRAATNTSGVRIGGSTSVASAGTIITGTSATIKVCTFGVGLPVGGSINSVSVGGKYAATEVVRVSALFPLNARIRPWGVAETKLNQRWG